VFVLYWNGKKENGGGGGGSLVDGTACESEGQRGEFRGQLGKSKMNKWEPSFRGKAGLGTKCEACCEFTIVTPRRNRYGPAMKNPRVAGRGGQEFG